MILWTPDETLDCLVCGHPIRRLDGFRPYNHLRGNATRAFGLANNFSSLGLKTGLVVEDDCVADCSPLIHEGLRIVERSKLAAAAQTSSLMLLCGTNLKTLHGFDPTPLSIVHPRKWASCCFDYNTGIDLPVLTRGIIGYSFNNPTHAELWHNRGFDRPVHVIPYGVDENEYIDDAIRPASKPTAIWIGAIRTPVLMNRIVRFAEANPECEVHVVSNLVFDQGVQSGAPGSFEKPHVGHADGAASWEKFSRTLQQWLGRPQPANLRYLGPSPGENADLLGGATLALGFSRGSYQTHDDSKILEYLRSGLPVICDEGQPSSRFVSQYAHGCVLPCAPDYETLRKGFRHALALSATAIRQSMATRIRNQFGWPTVARQLLEWISQDIERDRHQPLPPPAIDHIATLEGYRNKHVGKRCFVVGCAPSLKQMDLSLLEGEYAFSVNRGYLSASFGLPTSTYYVVGDPQTYQAYWKEIRAAKTGTRFYKANVFDLPEYKQSPDREHAIRVPFHHTPTMDEGHFARDATNGLHRGFTVVLDAVQLAYMMGFSEVYIIGCDLDYHGSQTHVYGTGEYEQRRKNDMPIAKVLQSMSVALDEYTKAGRILANAGVGGNLNTIPRVDFPSLFR